MQIRTQDYCTSVSVAGDAWCQIRMLCTCQRGSREKSRAPRRAAAVLQVPEKHFELLSAFSRIESPAFRRMIIGMAREAVRASGPSEPPSSTA
jgi:hypothetical protein